jgi:hypothetical protein
VPVFFGYRPPRQLVAISWALLEAGIILFGGDALVAATRGNGVLWMQSAGLLCLGAALVAFACTTGTWKPAGRLRPSVRPVAGFLTAAFFWCAAAGVLACIFAVRDWTAGERLSSLHEDAIRHLLTAGLVSTIIVGMAHLVVPALATQRLTSRAARLRLSALKLLLALAVLLRAVPPLLPGIDGHVRDGMMGAAGVLGWLAIAIFAWALRRARIEQPGLIALFAEGPRRV